MLGIGNLSQNYGASPTMWDHTVLAVTRHRWTRPALTPAGQAGTRFTYRLLHGDGRLSCPWWLVIYRAGLLVRRQSLIQVVTIDSDPTRRRTLRHQLSHHVGRHKRETSENKNRIQNLRLPNIGNRPTDPFGTILLMPMLYIHCEA